MSNYRAFRRKTLPLGSVSEGTLRNEDLFRAFADAADNLKMRRAQRMVVNEMLTHDHVRLQDCEDAECLASDVEALIDILNEYVPDYCYFGAHEGDGANYGVWPTSDVPFYRDGNDEIGKGSELPKAKDVTQDYWLTVGDHGNCTLYRKSKRGFRYGWVEVWSMV